MWRICLVIFNEREVVLELYLKRVRNCCCDLVGQSDSSTLSVVVSWSLHCLVLGLEAEEHNTATGWLNPGLLMGGCFLNVLRMLSDFQLPCLKPRLF